MLQNEVWDTLTIQFYKIIMLQNEVWDTLIRQGYKITMTMYFMTDTRGLWWQPLSLFTYGEFSVRSANRQHHSDTEFNEIRSIGLSLP